jgi:iron complex outermembrane recepter protein
MDPEVLESDTVRGVDVVGNQFAATPNHLASIWANYVISGNQGCGDISLGVGARYVGSYFFNAQNNNGKSEATTLIDAAATR